MKVVVFDLDDTLYKEIDFLKSAYREIVATIGPPEAYAFMLKCYRAGENAFERVIEQYNLSYTKDQLLDRYRNHKPSITLDDSTVSTLDNFKADGVRLCLLTDGRSITQRNKIDALGLGRWIEPDDILISEEFGYGKPDERCYQYFINRYPGAIFYYVGDNLNKDFVTANRLGWQTICLLDNGNNIHSQQVSLTEEYQPQHTIKELSKLLTIII